MEGLPREERVSENIRDKAIEVQLFGSELEEGSPLLNLYKYFSSEQMSEIQTQLNFNWGDFNGIEEASQLDLFIPEIQALAQYKSERETYGPYIKNAEVMALKAKYTPIAKDLSKKLFAL